MEALKALASVAVALLFIAAVVGIFAATGILGMLFAFLFIVGAVSVGIYGSMAKPDDDGK